MVTVSKPLSMWNRSRTRLLGSVTNEQVERAERTVARVVLPPKAPSAVKRWQCTARRFDERYVSGYVCVHAGGHDSMHRDKHGVEWCDG